ncbi:MAG: transcription elongation factor GreA [Proteobacteria bacterium]|nr:transcription elongation factor GreA [Cystobacterineae bacterium]MCL2258527.1 transcription elongation factor GreA [Cystobacterineae bacterium]MCL2315245.1 transcription elongation factor GreA [Pseudomonadota bacterium]
MQRFPITPVGLQKLKDELKQLLSVERPRISKEIETARAHGDLKENAEYHAAKEKQSHIEGRILELNHILAHVEVIDVSQIQLGDSVVFGTTVELLDLENERKLSYRLVGEAEVDLKKRWISISSPVGKQLIGKKVGEDVTVHTPNGIKEYQILSVVIQDERE